MKVLIVKEKLAGGNDIIEFLEKEGYILDSVTSLSEANQKINIYEYDCILLDGDLLGKNTFSLIEQVSGLSRTDGLVILSKGLTPEERVKALELGADDIIIFPPNLPELNARVKAIIRRKKFHSKNRIYFGNIIIDIFSKSVLVWSTPVNLTKKEFEILLYLISNKNKVVSKTSLAEYLWGETAEHLDSYDALFTHLKNLRKKLKEVKAEVEFKSIYGVGYQIIEL